MMKINVGVFFGGSSVEHEVSIISAVQAMRYLDRDKYDVVPIYIAKTGDFYTDDSMLEIESFRDLPALLKRACQVVVRKEDSVAYLFRTKGGFGSKKPLTRIDIALPIVHGTNCEDGTLQGFLELLSIPYCGCDVMASSIGMDKELFKYAVASKGIPALPCVCFYAKEWFSDQRSLSEKIAENCGYPVIVKPANLGSSVGIKKVNTPQELPEAVEYACSFAEKILVEKAICSLREINCSVLGDVSSARASVCEEPIMQDAILSYEDKYMPGSSSKGMSSLKRKLPAEISAEKYQEIADYSVRAFRAIGACGVVRIDYLMDTADNDCIYINEINTIPGSLAFYLWEASGVKYSQLLDELIELGFKRARAKEKLSFSFETNILSNAGFGSKGSKGKA